MTQVILLQIIGVLLILRLKKQLNNSLKITIAV
jgi:hypothetical protein